MKLCRQAGIIGVCISLLSGIASQALSQISITVATRYDYFVDDRSPESFGYEFTVPIGIAYKAERFSVTLETAYGDAHVDWYDGTTGRLASPTDTLLSASYSVVFPGRPYALLTGLDLNLPTGKATLHKKERWAEAGESNDLFEVDDFGTGLNIAPSLGLLREFEQVNLVLQGAYIFNGEYNPTAEISEDDLNPGNQLFLLGGLEWRASPQLSLGLFSSYSYFTPDQVNGKEAFREGQRLVFGGNLRFNYAPIGVVFSAQYAIQDNSEVLVDGELERETENSNGDEFFGLLLFTYTFTRNFTLRLQGDIRYYGESEFKDQDTGLAFSGERVRYAFGPGFFYRLRNNLACNALFKMFTMDAKQDMFEEQNVFFWGTNLDIGFTYFF